MTEPIEDQLRAHFAARAARIQVDPDPGALIERSAGRSRRWPLAVGAVAVAVVLAGSGALTGAALAGGRSPSKQVAAVPAATGGAGRAGVMVAPGHGGASVPVPTLHYTSLFTRTTASGVTIRAYRSPLDVVGGCTQNVPCPPVGRLPSPVPCPAGGVCAQPELRSPGQPGATGGGKSAGSVAGSAGAGAEVPAPLPPVSTGPATPVPALPIAACGQLVVELSTDEAVGSASVSGSSTATPAPDSVAILGQGSFGTEEGAPVGWVAAQVGDGVTAVALSSGGSTVDTMAPSSGIVVLAVPGDPDLSGATVIGVGLDGAALSPVPADQAPDPEPADGCSTGSAGPTTTTTTTMAPPTTTPTTAPTVPTTTTPTTTTAPPTTTMPTTSTTTAPTGSSIPTAAGVPSTPAGHPTTARHTP